MGFQDAMKRGTLHTEVLLKDAEIRHYERVSAIEAKLQVGLVGIEEALRVTCEQYSDVGTRDCAGDQLREKNALEVGEMPVPDCPLLPPSAPVPAPAPAQIEPTI